MSLLDRIRRARVAHGARRMATLPAALPPTISFTFDDFPLSAVEAGRPILEAAGMCATWYATGSLLGGDSPLGRLASPADLAALHAVGHEIGNHGYTHVDAGRVGARAYAADIVRNQAALSAITGVAPRSFAYPFGRATVGTKRATAAHMASSRSTVHGIARGSVDLAMLPAVRLYSADVPFADIATLIDDVRQRGGWLIFYTHDVAASPSPWGCTPDYLADVVDAVAKAGVAVAPVGTVTAALPTP